ncbi:hypothetical protein [Blastococcus sp. SYSU D00695]
MSAPAPPLSGFDLLDRLITEAFCDLRVARAAAARTGDRANQDRVARAEEHVDALLEYRHAAARRLRHEPADRTPALPLPERVGGPRLP